MLTSDQKRMLKILNDTIEYYASDPSRRAYHNGACVYRTPEGNKCALGRYIRDDVYEPWMECGIVSNLIDILQERGLTLNDILVEEAYDLPKLFWDYLQSLHDIKLHWSDTGLTVAGVQYVLSIQQRILTNNMK